MRARERESEREREREREGGEKNKKYRDIYTQVNGRLFNVKEAKIEI